MIILVFLGCNFIFVWYIRGTVLWWGLVFIIEQGYFDNRYISANRSQTDQVKKRICCIHRWNVSGAIVSTRLAGRFFACMQMVLGRTCERVFGSVRFLFERYQAGWFHSRKLWNRQAKLYFMGIPIMRTKLATTAFKMPLHGISFLLSLKNTVLWDILIRLEFF